MPDVTAALPVTEKDTGYFTILVLMWRVDLDGYVEGSIVLKFGNPEIIPEVIPALSTWPFPTASTSTNGCLGLMRSGCHPLRINRSVAW